MFLNSAMAYPFVSHSCFLSLWKFFFTGSKRFPTSGTQSFHFISAYSRSLLCKASQSNVGRETGAPGAGPWEASLLGLTTPSHHSGCPAPGVATPYSSFLRTLLMTWISTLSFFTWQLRDEAAKNVVFPPSLAEKNLQKHCVEKCISDFTCMPRFTYPRSGNRAFTWRGDVLYPRENLHNLWQANSELHLEPVTVTVGCLTPPR